ncbi:hypothetical protein [Phytoactinopolyspora endophytica]|uniref:hypothetical protein n=1 Tax=Phytoactinopolyspora endophytica TaxID=1642495 RepID=UPI00101CC942|nr:hypothetical protein [Phytoactinopolyspora endophytica]
MRTTVDLPDDLIRAAKARAAERGESLKELFTRVLSREVRTPASQREGGSVSLPLVGGAGGPSVDVTNADIEAALAAEDAERYGR